MKIWLIVLSIVVIGLLVWNIILTKEHDRMWYKINWSIGLGRNLAKDVWPFVIELRRERGLPDSKYNDSEFDNRSK